MSNIFNKKTAQVGKRYKASDNSNYVGIYCRLAADGRTYIDVVSRQSGKLKWHKIGTIEEGFNLNYAKGFLTKLKAGIDPLAHRRKKEIITVNDIAQQYFSDNEGVMIDLQKVKQKYKKHLSEKLGLYDVEELTPLQIEQFRRDMLVVGYSKMTVNWFTTYLLKAIYNHAIKHEIIKCQNPVCKIDSLKLDNNRERVLSSQEVSALLKAVKDESELEKFVYIMVYTGARPDAILSLRRCDIDFSGEGEIYFKGQKGAGSFSVPMLPKLKSFLAKKVEGLSKTTYIIQNFMGEQLPYKTMVKNLSPILNILFNEGLDKNDTKRRVVAYTLRHTFATMIAASDIHPVTLQRLLNHADARTTARYIKTTSKTMRAAITKAFDDFMEV